MSAWPEDPSQFGPYPVETFSVALNPLYLNVNLTSNLPLMVQYWYPVTENGLTGPIVPVFILHGRVQSDQIAPYSYQGFDYLGQLLASYGMFVVSVQQPQLLISQHGGFTPDRGQRILGALNWTGQLNSGVGLEPSFENLGNYLKGMLLMDQMAAVGHSAGGQLLCSWPNMQEFKNLPYPFAALVCLSPDLIPDNQQQTPKVLDLLAPPPGVPFQLIHGSVDCMFCGAYGGWVSYEDLLTESDCVLRSWVMIDQGNHYFFNSNWTIDECSFNLWYRVNPLIDPSLMYERIAAQTAVTATYINAFLRTALNLGPSVMTGQSFYLQFLNGSTPNPLLSNPEFQDSPFVNVRLDCRMPASSILALVDNFEIAWSGTEQPNSIGGSVSASGSVNLSQISLQSNFNTVVPISTTNLLAARITWTGPDAVVDESFGAATVNIIPDSILDRRYLCFRVGIVEHWPNDNPPTTVDFNIVLVDVNGNLSNVVPVSEFQTIGSSWPSINYPGANYSEPTPPDVQVMRHSFLQLVRIPTACFAVSTFGSSQVNGIRFLFNAASSPTGDIAIDEIHFSY